MVVLSLYIVGPLVLINLVGIAGTNISGVADAGASAVGQGGGAARGAARGLGRNASVGTGAAVGGARNLAGRVGQPRQLNLPLRGGRR